MENIDLGLKAKATLESLVPLVDQKLKNFWEKESYLKFGLNQDQSDLVAKMIGHASEHNLRAGKRIRAAFVYYGYLLGKSRISEKIWQACEAIELIHTALLMHDDFMDEDKVRRGKPTSQEYFAERDKHYGESMAVLTGDAVLTLGYQRLLSCDFDFELVKRALDQVLRGVTNTVWGQAYDISLPKIGKMTESEVIALHQAKTAIYTYENPLVTGAILAGVSEEVIEVLKKYAMKAGVAFQLQDDILGVFGDEEKTGKSANSDLLQGKSTLLVIKAMEKANEEQRRVIAKVWGKKMASDFETDEVKRIIKETGSYDYSVSLAKHLACEAVGEIRVLRKMQVNMEAVDFIEGVAQYMVEREM